MMRCRGKFLWILNWVKACSSQEFWEILSFTTRLFWPLQEDFSCAVFRYKTRLRNQCNPHFSLWIVILLSSRNLRAESKSHRCWKIELHLFWTPRIFDVRSKMTLCAEMHWNVSFFYSRYDFWTLWDFLEDFWVTDLKVWGH